MEIKGIGTALVTPFENGKVDFVALKKLILMQLEAKIDFLVPLGTTGETPCLEDEEKVEILKFIRKEAPTTPLVVGVGTNSLQHTIRNIKLLEPCGADAFLVVVPFYNKPTQEGMYQYFREVAKSTSKPIVLYNVPGRTGSNMTAETCLRLANDVENIVAIKEASGNFEQVKEIIEKKPKGFSLLSGNDDEILKILKAGGDGMISVVTNIAPKIEMELYNSFIDNDLDRAEELCKRLEPLYDACFVESNPIPTKAALNIMDMMSDEMRLPLTPATTQTIKLLESILPNIL